LSPGADAGAVQRGSHRFGGSHTWVRLRPCATYALLRTCIHVDTRGVD
jgi:hypothetical protein